MRSRSISLREWRDGATGDGKLALAPDPRLARCRCGTRALRQSSQDRIALTVGLLEMLPVVRRPV